MKRETVPTSPQELIKQPIKTKQPSSLSNIFFIISNVVVSIMAGIFGAVMFHIYPETILFNSNSDNTSSNVLRIKNYIQPTTVQLTNVLQTKQNNTIVTLYAGKNSLINKEQELGTGIIISTDGWIVTLKSIVKDKTDITVLLNSGKSYVAKQIIADDYNDTVFIKIAASNLPIIDIANDPVGLGDLVVNYTYSMRRQDRIEYSYVEMVNYNNVDTWSTTHNNNLLYISDALESEYIGSPVFDKNGELIGLNLLQHKVLPVTSVVDNFYTLFSAGKLAQTKIDITYQPLYNTVQDDKLIGSGARIVDSQTAQLLPGDIIKKVNGVILNEQNDLAAILHELDPDSLVKFDIERNDGKMIIEI